MLATTRYLNWVFLLLTSPLLCSCSVGNQIIHKLQSWLTSAEHMTRESQVLPSDTAAKEGEWHNFHYLVNRKDGQPLEETDTGINVVRSVEFFFGGGGVKYLAVSWLVSNTGRIPTEFDWENKYLQDKNGNLYSPAHGNGTETIQPNMKTSKPLILTYEVPDSIGESDILWGLYQKGHKNLTYAVALAPKKYESIASICTGKNLPDVTRLQNYGLFNWQDDREKKCLIYLLTVDENKFRDEMKSVRSLAP